MDDATETIFRALERDKGYDGIQAVNRVSIINVSHFIIEVET